MNFIRFSVLFLMLMGLTPPVRGIDRAAVHASRLPEIDPTVREQTVIHKYTPFGLAAGIDETVISETTTPARFNQDRVGVCSLAGERWLVAWSDERLGADKIFIQELALTGGFIGDNRLLAGSEIGADFVDARLKTDTLGRIYLFYRDRTSGFIFGSRYNSDLSVSLPPFLVNDTGLAAFGGPFDFDIYPNGRTVAVWENYSATGSNIYMRIYDNSGNTLKGPSPVNSGGGTAMKWVPSVAVQPGGGFLVGWEDYRNGRADIYARLFDGNGTAVGNEFTLIPPPADGSDQYLPRIVYSPSYGFVLGWIDLRDSHEIYLQQYSSLTGPVGDNRPISIPDIQVENWDLALAVGPDGKLLATWASFGIQSKIMGLRFDNALNPIGTPRQLNRSLLEQRWSPAAAFARADRPGVAWTEFTGSDADIHFMPFDTSWNALAADEIKLNDDTAGAPSLEPDIVTLTNWYNLVVFTDRRNDIGDIYLQAVTHNREKVGVNRRVNQDIGCNLQSEPAAAVSSDGALTVWVDGRAVNGLSGQRIYGRFCDVYGNFTGNEFMISDTLQPAVKGGPSAAVNSTGRGLVVWADKRTGTAQIYGRWLTAVGLPDGAEFAVSSSGVDIDNGGVLVVVDEVGNFYVVWLDYGQTPPQVKVKWFHSDKTTGGSFGWSSSVAGVDIYDMAADISRLGNIFLLFNGVESGYYKLYLTVLSRDGVVLRTPQAVTDIEETDALEPAVAVDENDYVTTAWLDNRDGKKIVYYQLFDNSLAPQGANLPVSAAVPEFMQSPAVDAVRGRAWLTWSDPRDNGLNVQAGNYLYLATDVDDDEPLVPETFSLAQNYPNPFNPSTVIIFSLPKTMDINLTVYNLLGREVTTLARGAYPAGEHRLVWNGTDKSNRRVASGVYLYRLTGESYSQERKMILLK
ncbi:MAG: T9SS type A sorting domain-containing protein [candidate division Zixibacteria bacterium]|nr:T9SS type A sorting domain-containing protein [candidate division Zixibacteria bacterium]